MCSYNDHEEQTLWTTHHPDKYPQANIRCLPPHNYPNCQPISAMGEFCEEWKTAIVKPLLKKPGLDLINKNYRSISNLPFISRLVEKCMLKQLLGHCKNHDLLLDFQSAYHECYSTETSLIKLTKDILWSMERQQMTAIAILYLSAAFNTTDHEILLQILENFGFCSKALHWFQNYLRLYHSESTSMVSIQNWWILNSVFHRAAAVEPTSSHTIAH